MKSEVMRNERGITFAEVIICVFIVAMIVTPMISAFMSSNKARETANRTEQATANAEKLLEAIKTTMTQDIVMMQKYEAQQLKLSPATQTRYTDCVQKYLNETPDTTNIYKLSDFLINIPELHTDRYAYEVMLWNINKVTGFDTAANELVVNQAALNDCFKVYTDNQYNFINDQASFNQISLPISFKLTDEMKKAFKDEKKRYIPQLDPASTVFEVKESLKLKFDDYGKPEADGTTTYAELKGIESIKRSNGDITGYVIHIKDKSGAPSYIPAVSGARTFSQIEVDINKLLRDGQSETDLSAFNNYVYTFINETDTDMVIRLKRSGTNLAVVDERIQFRLEKQGTGDLSLERIDEVSPYDNYIIAILVREKNPLLGQQGRIVKKMLDIYSYDLKAPSKVVVKND